MQTAAGVYQARALIWAAGQTSRRLNVPGEEKFLGRGISFCATCDGALYRGREVAVIGGGNTALEEALFLAGICSRVHLIHRRAEFRAEKLLVERAAKADNIVRHMPAKVTAVLGEKRLSELELAGPAGPEKLPVAAAFLAVGKIPANALLAGLVPQDEAGYLLVGEDCRTNVPGLFAAGDCRRKPLRQLVTAAADGAVAATAALAYLRGA